MSKIFVATPSTLKVRNIHDAFNKLRNEMFRFSVILEMTVRDAPLRAYMHMYIHIYIHKYIYKPQAPTCSLDMLIFNALVIKISLEDVSYCAFKIHLVTRLMLK